MHINEAIGKKKKKNCIIIKQNNEKNWREIRDETRRTVRDTVVNRGFAIATRAFVPSPIDHNAFPSCAIISAAATSIAPHLLSLSLSLSLCALKRRRSFVWSVRLSLIASNIADPITGLKVIRYLYLSCVIYLL